MIPSYHSDQVHAMAKVCTTIVTVWVSHIATLLGMTKQFETVALCTRVHNTVHYVGDKLCVLQTYIHIRKSL